MERQGGSEVRRRGGTGDVEWEEVGEVGKDGWEGGGSRGGERREEGGGGVEMRRDRAGVEHQSWLHPSRDSLAPQLHFPLGGRGS